MSTKLYAFRVKKENWWLLWEKLKKFNQEHHLVHIAKIGRAHV